MPRAARIRLLDPVHEIVVKTDRAKSLRILSNDLDTAADEIANLHTRRWLIELFFRLMRQTLKIRRFIGRSQNAVRIQLAVAPIAHLLLHMLQKITKAEHGFLELARLARANPMHRKSVSDLEELQHLTPIDPRQYELPLCDT